MTDPFVCICDPDDLFDPPDPRPRAVEGCPAHRGRRAAQLFEQKHMQQPAAEPAPVPPPVDALLKLVDEFGREAHAYGLGDDSFGDTMTDSWKEINSRVRALWAAGVEEGRREDERALMQALMERDDYEEIADKLTSAVGRHLGVDMGEHSNANSPWENALNALDEADGGKFVKGAYEDGVAEGRRQATEERTEERTATLTEAYWKLRQHAEELRSTFVYTNAQERAREATEAAREGVAMGSDGRWREKAAGLRSFSRGIEAGARALAELLGVEEHEIEQPVRHG